MVVRKHQHTLDHTRSIKVGVWFESGKQIVGSNFPNFPSWVYRTKSNKKMQKYQIAIYDFFVIALFVLNCNIAVWESI